MAIRRGNIAELLNERRRRAEEDEPVNLEAINRRRFDRFLQNIQEGKDYTFLSVYFFTIHEAEEIAAELRVTSTLEYLSMPSCYCGRRKILTIMSALKQNPQCRLVYLDLNDNRLEDLGCKVVCDFLKDNRTIEHVGLRANRITGQGTTPGAKALADVLKVNPKITRLDVGHNKFGVEGASFIDEALEHNDSLIFLDMSRNDLKAPGVAALSNLFLKHKKLEFLRLQHNNIGLEGAEQVAAFLSQNMRSNLKQLTFLDQFTRLQVLRALMERCNLDEITDKYLERILLIRDFHDRKMITARQEWSTAKRQGRELVRIPQEVFEYQDAEAIKTFLKAALLEGLSANKGVKMLMVGRARAGKTSLTNSLVNVVPGLTDDNDDRATVSVEIRPWKVKDVTISVWDFAGQEEYYMTHTFFLSRRCVVVLIVDLSRYSDFRNDVYYWVKAIQAHVPGVQFFMVGTHIDEMEPEEIKARCDEILIKFQEEERAVVAALDKQLELLEEANQGNYAKLDVKEDSDDKQREEIERIEAEKRKREEEMTKQEAADLSNQYVEGGNAEVNQYRIDQNNNVVYLDSAQMLRIREQRDRRPSILHNKVYAVSSKQLEGVGDLREAIIAHATHEEVAIRLPNSFVQVLDKLKTYGMNNQAAPILPRSKVREVVGDDVYRKFDDDDQVDAALELLHLVGQILWYRNNSQLMDRVFVSPSWVVDITKALIRHDMFKTEHGNPGVLHKLKKPSNLKSNEFAAMKKRFETEAVFDMRFLGMLETWRNISELNRHKLVSLLKEFDLLISLPKRKKNDNDEALIPLYLKSSFHGKKEASKAAKLKRKVRKSIAAIIGEELAKKDAKMDTHRITWRYDLKEYFPEGIFYRLLVRCYSLGKIKSLEEDTLYARIGNDIKIVVKEDRKNKFIMIAASHKKNLQLVWPALVLYATEFEDLLRTAYKGVTCQVVCVAGDSRLRERALCTHEEHKDMVPPLEYMHVVWGNINAVQVGVLLRLNNISQHVERLKEAKDESEASSFGTTSEIHLLGKEAYSLLERLLQNICKINDIPMRNGRNVVAYLSSIRDSPQYKNAGKSGEWEGEKLDEEKLSDAFGIARQFKSVVDVPGSQLDQAFLEKLVVVTKKFIPELAQKDTEYEINLRNNLAGMGIEPTKQFLKERMQVAFDAIENIKEVEATAEAVGENEELAFTVQKPDTQNSE